MPAGPVPAGAFFRKKTPAQAQGVTTVYRRVNMGYLAAVLLAFGVWSGHAAADDVLTAGDDVTDAAFAAGAVETDVLADERGASAIANDNSLAIDLDINSENVVFADSDSTTNQEAEQDFDINTNGGDVHSSTGEQTGNTFSDNRFSIGLFNTGNNVTMGASMNVNIIFSEVQ